MIVNDRMILIAHGVVCAAKSTTAKMTCCLLMIVALTLIVCVCAQSENANPSDFVGKPATTTTNANGRVPGATLTVVALPPGIGNVKPGQAATTSAMFAQPPTNEGTDAAVTTTTTTLATTTATTTTTTTTGIITSAATATTPDQKTSGVVETVQTGGPLDGSLPAWAIAVISVGICLGLTFSALAVVLLARKKRDSAAEATATAPAPTHTHTRSSTYASIDGTPLATSNSYDAPPAAVFVTEASASNSNQYDAVDDPLSL